MDTPPHDNRIYYRCRHCKQLTKEVRWSQGKWPLCPHCDEAAYHKFTTRKDKDGQ